VLVLLVLVVLLNVSGMRSAVLGGGKLQIDQRQYGLLFPVLMKATKLLANLGCSFEARRVVFDQQDHHRENHTSCKISERQRIG